MEMPLIMLVDDSELDQYINKLILKQSSLDGRLLQYVAAKDALAYLKDHQYAFNEIPDILLLDINMPEMNGFEFLNEFEKLPELIKSKCNIYILSSSCDPEDLRRANGNPYVKSFIEKPLSKQFVKEELVDHYLQVAV